MGTSGWNLPFQREVTDLIDWITQAVYDGEGPEHAEGAYMYGHQTPIFTGYGLDYFGMALAALEDAGYRLEPRGSLLVHGTRRCGRILH